MRCSPHVHLDVGRVLRHGWVIGAFALVAPDASDATPKSISTHKPKKGRIEFGVLVSEKFSPLRTHVGRLGARGVRKYERFIDVLFQLSEMDPLRWSKSLPVLMHELESLERAARPVGTWLTVLEQLSTDKHAHTMTDPTYLQLLGLDGEALHATPNEQLAAIVHTRVAIRGALLDASATEAQIEALLVTLRAHEAAWTLSQKPDLAKEAEKLLLAGFTEGSRRDFEDSLARHVQAFVPWLVRFENHKWPLLVRLALQDMMVDRVHETGPLDAEAYREKSLELVMGMRRHGKRGAVSESLKEIAQKLADIRRQELEILHGVSSVFEEEAGRFAQLNLERAELFRQAYALVKHLIDSPSDELSPGIEPE